MHAYGNATLPDPICPSFEKSSRPVRTGAQIQPSPLNDWAKFKRLAAVSFGPSSVAYGLAAVSRNVNPHPITNKANRKKLKDR
jgi:hypothetical protein